MGELHLKLMRLIGEQEAIDGEDQALAVMRAAPEPIFVPIKEAAGWAGCEVSTVKRWCRLHGVGWQVGGQYGRWVVSRDEFLDFLGRRSREVRRAS